MNNSMFYYLHTQAMEELRNTHILQQLFDSLTTHEYRLVASAEASPSFRVWWRELYPEWANKYPLEETDSSIDVDALFTAGLSAQLQTEVEHYRIKQLEQLTLKAYSVARTGPMKGFEFELKLQPQELMISTDYNGQFFYKTDQQSAIASFEQWLHITLLPYTLWNPLYGYSFSYQGNMFPTLREDIEALKPEWLYEINLFGPEMVESLGGREHIQATPAHIVRALDNGGALIIPQMSFYPGVLQYEWEIVAEYLGLKCPDL